MKHMTEKRTIEGEPVKHDGVMRSDMTRGQG